jgi:hypothetical protein
LHIRGIATGALFANLVEVFQEVRVNMKISEMLDTLIQLGYVTPRGDHPTATIGSFRDVPSLTLYGDSIESAMIIGTSHAKLEQRFTGNSPRPVA